MHAHVHRLKQVAPDFISEGERAVHPIEEFVVSTAPRRLYHSFWMLFALTAAAGTTTACSNGEANPGEMGDVTSAVSAPSSAAPIPACSTPSENCPCGDDGLTVQCTGPKIHIGNYTSCLPGVRVCMSGTWSACVGRSVYQDVDTVTQDYTSPCAPGKTVRWGALTIQGDTPGGSEIAVAVESADSTSALDAIEPSLVGGLDGASSAPWTGIDVGAALANDGLASAKLLRVTLRLIRASASSPSPVVMGFQQATTCVAE
jgi:hypothetical protein